MADRKANTDNDVERFERDLHPDPEAGQNRGTPSSEHEIGLRTAFDVKHVHRCLRDLPDDELKEIPVLGRGERLQQGATYMDLRHPDAGEFTAMGGQTVEPDQDLVPKDRVQYGTWNRLRGVDDPERL
jgi:hypothetical protein